MDSYWLRQYSNVTEYQWKRERIEGRLVFHRPLGLVESSFDSDGRYFEGRADMNDLIELNVRTTLSQEGLRRRIDLAWTCLRCRHSLLRARTIRLRSRQISASSFAPDNLHIAVDNLESVEGALSDAIEHVVHLVDNFEGPIEAYDFYQHTQNCARVVNPDVALAKLFVFPLEETLNEHSVLRFLLVGGHQIWDGLTCSSRPPNPEARANILLSIRLESRFHLASESDTRHH